MSAAHRPRSESVVRRFKTVHRPRSSMLPLSLRNSGAGPQGLSVDEVFSGIAKLKDGYLPGDKQGRRRRGPERRLERSAPPGWTGRQAITVHVSVIIVDDPVWRHYAPYATSTVYRLRSDFRIGFNGPVSSSQNLEFEDGVDRLSSRP